MLEVRGYAIIYNPFFQGWTYYHFWRRRENWHLVVGCWWAVSVKGLNFLPGGDWCRCAKLRKHWEAASPLGKTDSLAGVVFRCLLSSASASAARCCTSSVCFLPISYRSLRLQQFQLDLVQSRATLPLTEVRTFLSECQMPNPSSFCWLCDWKESDTFKK